MKSFLLSVLLTVAIRHAGCAVNYKAGFSLPDSVREFSINYKSMDHLIILPVTINDSIHVNLILDTGCRNIILFGRRFINLFNFKHGRTVEFSGMGSGRGVKGTLSVNNSISIGAVKGELIPIVVVPTKSIMAAYDQVHGIIGYDIFSRFEIEVNPATQIITFRSPHLNYIPEGFVQMPLEVTDSRPMIHSYIQWPNNTQCWDVLIDTGSILGLLLKVRQATSLESLKHEKNLGMGLNGLIKGFEATLKELRIASFKWKNLTASIIHSEQENYASIGMGFLKNYSIILNYSRSYACFKQLS